MVLVLCLFLLETNPVKLVLKIPIKIYQQTASKAQGEVCNFNPTCSHFTYEAIDRYGPFGIILGADRLERCNLCVWSYYGRYYHSLKEGRIYDPVKNHNPFTNGNRRLSRPLWH
ncbi:MAG TPA: membrane protein insertion efficiency factor YidD [bacterium (Candidatus Stahlbacteria)]|nr:membrane protein insertion efficiency factor YidD [Candidatus Stahlbacteria bacterium]